MRIEFVYAFLRETEEDILSRDDVMRVLESRFPKEKRTIYQHEKSPGVTCLYNVPLLQRPSLICDLYLTFTIYRTYKV